MNFKVNSELRYVLLLDFSSIKGSNLVKFIFRKKPSPQERSSIKVGTNFLIRKDKLRSVLHKCCCDNQTAHPQQICCQKGSGASLKPL